MKAASLEVDLEQKAKDIGLTEQQKKFCEYFVLVTGMDSEKAIALADIKIGDEKALNSMPEEQREHNLSLLRKKRARDLLTNRKITSYISVIRDTMDQQLVVDKFWVINKLKSLSEQGSERTQLEATKLLGQTMNMFQAEQVIAIGDNPGEIVKAALARRKQEGKEGNTIPFPTEGQA